MNNKPTANSQQLTATKRKTFHALMANLGIMHNKPDILAGYGVESTLDLEDSELDEIIYRLKQMQVGKTEPTPLMRKWRSNCLTVLNQLGIYGNSGDWNLINRFLLDPRICGKFLYELTVPELEQLHVKLLSIKNKQKPLSKINYSLN